MRHVLIGFAAAAALVAGIGAASAQLRPGRRRADGFDGQDAGLQGRDHGDEAVKSA